MPKQISICFSLEVAPRSESEVNPRMLLQPSFGFIGAVYREIVQYDFDSSSRIVPHRKIEHDYEILGSVVCSGSPQHFAGAHVEECQQVTVPCRLQECSTRSALSGRTGGVAGARSPRSQASHRTAKPSVLRTPQDCPAIQDTLDRRPAHPSGKVSPAQNLGDKIQGPARLKPAKIPRILARDLNYPEALLGGEFGRTASAGLVTEPINASCR